jgi:hypothetical protein
MMINGHHWGTAHEPGRDLNDFNPGQYTRNGRWVRGWYLNSHRRLSRYRGIVVDAGDGIAMTIGVVTGYPGHPVLPFVSFTIRLRSGWLLTMIPSTKLNGRAIHLQWEEEGTTAAARGRGTTNGAAARAA